VRRKNDGREVSVGMTGEETMERPPTARSAARRQRLLDIARTLFVNKGFHQTGIAQIAGASGIAVGQIYRDFANKEAIITAICEANLMTWLEEEKLEAAVKTRDTGAIRRWIMRIATHEHSLEDRRLMAELLAETGRNPKISALSRNASEKLHHCLDAALCSLAPGTQPARRATIAAFIMALSWAIVARTEMAPDLEIETLRAYIAALLDRELSCLAG
jgi:AcrR family transcriptional regulator